MRIKYWRLQRCPHEWESVSSYFNGWDDYVTLFCPYCRCFRKIKKHKAKAIINSQKVLREYGFEE